MVDQPSSGYNMSRYRRIKTPGSYQQQDGPLQEPLRLLLFVINDQVQKFLIRCCLGPIQRRRIRRNLPSNIRNYCPPLFTQRIMVIVNTPFIAQSLPTTDVMYQKIVLDLKSFFNCQLLDWTQSVRIWLVDYLFAVRGHGRIYGSREGISSRSTIDNESEYRYQPPETTNGVHFMLSWLYQSQPFPRAEASAASQIMCRSLGLGLDLRSQPAISLDLSYPSKRPLRNWQELWTSSYSKVLVMGSLFSRCEGRQGSGSGREILRRKERK